MLEPPVLPLTDLACIETPVLVIWGDRDQFAPVEQYRALPHAQLDIVPGADHFVTRTHQPQFAHRVAELLLALS